VGLVVDVVAAADIGQRLVAVKGDRLPFHQGGVDGGKVGADGQGHPAHHVGDDPHRVHVDGHIAVDGLAVQQGGDGQHRVFTALFPAVAVVVGQGELLVVVGHDVSVDAPHRHLHDAVPVELQHLPSLVDVVQHDHHLDVGLAAARVAVDAQSCAGSIHTHHQIGFQSGALAVGLTVPGHFL